MFVMQIEATLLKFAFAFSVCLWLQPGSGSGVVTKHGGDTGTTQGRVGCLCGYNLLHGDDNPSCQNLCRLQAGLRGQRARGEEGACLEEAMSHGCSQGD